MCFAVCSQWKVPFSFESLKITRLWKLELLGFFFHIAPNQNPPVTLQSLNLTLKIWRLSVASHLALALGCTVKSISSNLQIAFASHIVVSGISRKPTRFALLNCKQTLHSSFVTHCNKPCETNTAEMGFSVMVWFWSSSSSGFVW